MQNEKITVFQKVLEGTIRNNLILMSMQKHKKQSQPAGVYNLILLISSPFYLFIFIHWSKKKNICSALFWKTRSYHAEHPNEICVLGNANLLMHLFSSLAALHA